MEREYFPALFGNEKLKAALGESFAARRHSHAYILEGEAGCGKMTAALSMAASLACERRETSRRVPCMECVACRKVFGGFSPDVEVISLTDRKSIGVDSVRAIREGLYVTPNDGDFRVYIIDDAETMTLQAQNALLISLEEPPPFVVFILLVTASEKLIETIRSRAVLIRMERFTAERTFEFLSSDPRSAEIVRKNTENAKKLAEIHASSPGRALEALTAQSESKRPSKKSDGFDPRDAAEHLALALVTSDRAAALDVTRNLPKGSENSREVLSLCRDALRDVMIKKSSCRAPLLFYTDEKVPAALSKKIGTQRIAKLCSSLDEYIWLLSQNSSEVIIDTLAAVL